MTIKTKRNMETNEFNIEELRRQYNLLQQKVESQQIVNDRLLRESMKRKQSWSKNYVYSEILFCIPAFLICGLSLVEHDVVSIWPIVAVLPLMVADMVLDYRFNVFKRDAFQQKNLMGLARKMIKYKEWSGLQMRIFVPLILLWAVWMFIDIIGHSNGDVTFCWVMTISIIIGLVAGLAFAFHVDRRIQRDRQEVIDQIMAMQNAEA